MYVGRKCESASAPIFFYGACHLFMYLDDFCSSVWSVFIQVFGGLLFRRLANFYSDVWRT